MPVITFMQTKGGTGKTTSAFVLAEIIAKAPEAKVAVIDADKNHPFSRWQAKAGRDAPFTVIEADDSTLAQAIMDASPKYQFIIVDTEGSANKAAAQAVSFSDMVIITSSGKPLDQEHAAQALKFVRQVEKQRGSPIPAHVLMTMQKAVGQSRTVKEAIATMRGRGISVFEAQLIERDAFAALFGYSTLLFELDPKKVSHPDRAYFNARVFVNEVIETLKGKRGSRTPDQAKEAA